MSNKIEDIIQLINKYISCSKYMCLLLKESFEIGEATLLTAQKLKLIPKEGLLEEKVSYSFHGGGCYFEFENGTIDVDFGPADRCDGLDMHKLYNFLTDSNVSVCKELFDKNRFIESFNQLISDGYIVCPGWFPNPDLFYLKTSL